MQIENSIKFCAVSDSNIILFNHEKLPQITQLNKITETYNLTTLPQTILKNGLTFLEYVFIDPIYIHSINKIANKVGLNKIRSIIHYKGLNSIYRIKPFLLNPFTITQKNSLFDTEFNQIDLQVSSNISTNNLAKNNRYYGKKISEVNGIELSMDFGFLMGQLTY